MLARVLRTTRDILISATIFSGALYGYMWYTAKQNEKRYLAGIQSETLRDASRLSNDSFGISWGFQADDTIMSRIDSGDLLFLKYECEECLTPQSMVQCYLKTSHYLEEQYHSVGCAYRDQSGLYVLYNEFGETKLKGYCELVSLPYIRALTLQKHGSKAKKVHLNLRKEVDVDSAIKESSVEFAQRVDRLLGGSGQVTAVQELVNGQQKINIRTETNATLRSL